MLFKKYLNSLSKFQIFQLYTIITICILFPYFKYISIQDDTKIYSNENFVKINNNIKTLKEKLLPKESIKILKELELEAKKYKSLKIHNFNINKNSISLSGISKQEDFLKFLIFCENYSVTSRLSSISLKPLAKKHMYNFSLSIKFKNKYLAKISNDQNNILEKKIDSLNKKKKKNKLKLQAILNDQVIINNRFLSTGDIINKYKIEKIYKDHIIISKDKLIKKLHIKDIPNEQ